MKVIVNGQERDSTDVIAVDRLIELRKTKDVWTVIEEIINLWSARQPQKWDSYLIRLNDIKFTRKDRKFASTYDKKTGGTLRYTIDMPQQVFTMIRALYKSDELDMDRKFFMNFARKFPKFKIAEKL